MRGRPDLRCRAAAIPVHWLAPRRWRAKPLGAGGRRSGTRKLESEASALRAELRTARAVEERLAGAEEWMEGLKVDLAYAKGAEADAARSAREWKSKAESLEARLGEVSRLNRRNEEALASLTNTFEDCTSMLQDKQSQVLQLQGKVASMEKEASEHREGLLEATRRLDAATKEASELQATIDRLSSEHELLHEAHRQVAVAEKTASARVGELAEDKSRLLKELDDTRDERDKVKKAEGCGGPGSRTTRSLIGGKRGQGESPRKTSRAGQCPASGIRTEGGDEERRGQVPADA